MGWAGVTRAGLLESSLLLYSYGAVLDLYSLQSSSPYLHTKRFGLASKSDPQHYAQSPSQPSLLPLGSGGHV